MNESHPMAIAVVSDVSLGFGSPQVQALARSLGRHYAAPVTIYEPDQSGRPPVPFRQLGMQVRRITTEVTPHSRPGRIEYVIKTAEHLNREQPQVVVIFCTFALPVLAELKYRPRTVIYSLIEMVQPYGRLDVELNRYLAPKIDVLIFPEENRAHLDVERCGLHQVPLAVVYNVADATPVRTVPPGQRARRLFYGGAISSDVGLAEYFLHPDMQSIPIDLYGDVVGRDRESLLGRLNRGVGEPCYQGCVDSRTLARTRCNYAYSVVMYRPSREHTHFAAPNKFFEAIADGVPPIVAPHPQCKMLVERYECGIVMRDWNFEAYRDAAREALGLLGTRRYVRLVRNCQRAVREELNWPRQFAKVERLLPAA